MLRGGSRNYREKIIDRPRSQAHTVNLESLKYVPDSYLPTAMGQLTFCLNQLLEKLGFMR